MAKIAKAIRESGNAYTVTYPGRSDFDINVPWSCLLMLLEAGYTVELDNRGFDPDRHVTLPCKG